MVGGEIVEGKKEKDSSNEFMKDEGKRRGVRVTETPRFVLISVN